MWRIIKTATIVVLALFTLFIVYEVFTFPRVSELRTKNPETTSMIEQRMKEAEKEAKQEGDQDDSSWIPQMPNFKRGASTITQQLAKNLYLSSERTFARKAKEAAITYFLERSLSKCRILEIYLNVIEWGDG